MQLCELLLEEDDTLFLIIDQGLSYHVCLVSPHFLIRCMLRPRQDCGKPVRPALQSCAEVIVLPILILAQWLAREHQYHEFHQRPMEGFEQHVVLASCRNLGLDSRTRTLTAYRERAYLLSLHDRSLR